MEQEGNCDEESLRGKIWKTNRAGREYKLQIMKEPFRIESDNIHGQVYEGQARVS